MIYNLHNLRTVYQDEESKPIFSTKSTVRAEQQIDFHIDYSTVENLFKQHKVYNAFGREDTIYDIKLKPTIINIYKNKDFKSC